MDSSPPPRPSPRRRAEGFTLTDMLVVLLLALLATAAALPAAGKADEQNRRIKCASNLKQLGMAIQLYANENRGNFPQTRFDAENADKVQMFTNWKAATPLGDDGPKPNDVTAALFLLMRTQDIGPLAFVCPATDARPIHFGEAGGGKAGQGAGAEGKFDPVQREAAEAAEAARAAGKTGKAGDAPDGPAQPVGDPVGRSAQDLSNFPGLENLSYSYINPYPGLAARNAGFKLNYTLSSDFPLIADLNPGGEAVVKATPQAMPPASAGGAAAGREPQEPRKFSDEMRRVNSPNHGGFGQNVLYADGHVQWQPTPFCGVMRHKQGVAQWRDNLYTRHLAPAGADGPAAADAHPILGPSMDERDAVLLPVAQTGEAKKGAAKKPATPKR